MSMVSEFKEFISKGNVVDLAVGVIIGGAFGKIVTSMVADVLMPPIGLLVGGVSFTALKLEIGGKPEAPVTVNYGNFLQTIFDFLIVALCVFVVVKLVNAMRRKEEAAPAPAAPPAPTKEEQLLTEIRDLLKQK